MLERIEVPPLLSGDDKQQIEQLWKYLYKMSETVNNNFQALDEDNITDQERIIMRGRTGV